MRIDRRGRRRIRPSVGGQARQHRRRGHLVAHVLHEEKRRVQRHHLLAHDPVDDHLHHARILRRRHRAHRRHGRPDLDLGLVPVGPQGHAGAGMDGELVHDAAGVCRHLGARDEQSRHLPVVGVPRRLDRRPRHDVALERRADMPWPACVRGTRQPVAVSSSAGNSAHESGVFSISWHDAGVSRAGRRKFMGSVRPAAAAAADVFGEEEGALSAGSDGTFEVAAGADDASVPPGPAPPDDSTDSAAWWE